MAEEYADVTVKVPVNRVGEFYIMVGQWLDEVDEDGSDGSPEVAERLPWGPGDTEQAAEVWAKLSHAARELFSIMIDSPGGRFSGEDLARQLGLSGRNAVAGLLGWPGRHCNKVGREWMWDWDYPDKLTAVYWMNPQEADLFRTARDTKK